MTMTWLAATTAEGMFTGEPGITAENALLLATAGLTVAALGGGLFTLAGVLRMPRALA
jgi:hypothetical protein